VQHQGHAFVARTLPSPSDLVDVAKELVSCAYETLKQDSWTRGGPEARAAAVSMLTGVIKLLRFEALVRSYQQERDAPEAPAEMHDWELTLVPVLSLLMLIVAAMDDAGSLSIGQSDVQGDWGTDAALQAALGIFEHCMTNDELSANAMSSMRNPQCVAPEQIIDLPATNWEQLSSWADSVVQFFEAAKLSPADLPADRARAGAASFPPAAATPRCESL
jgi:hypothetical protein